MATALDNLRSQLENALEQLAKKEEDLKLSAEIGQSLLHSNEQLKKQLQQSKKLSSQDNEQQDEILTLEKLHLNLEKQLEDAKVEVEESKQNNLKHVKQLELDLKDSRHQISQLTQRIQDLEQLNLKLTQEKTQLSVRSNTHKSSTQESNQIQDRMFELETAVYQLANDKATLEMELLESRKLSDELSIRNEEMQMELADLQDMKQEFDVKNFELEQSAIMLEDARREIHVLSEKLMYSSDTSSINTNVKEPKNKSLFAEVEDRRIELEERYNNLSVKHAALLKAHSASLHQQDRLKNQINRLTQLSQCHGSEESVSRLDRMIRQLQSENKILTSKLSVMEKARRVMFSHSSGDTTYNSNTNSTLVHPMIHHDMSDGQSEVTLIYQMQFKQFTKEIEKLERELRTMGMIRMGDLEKCRVYEEHLSKREKECDGLRIQLAQLQFDLDELKAQFKLRDIVKDAHDFIAQNNEGSLERSECKELDPEVKIVNDEKIVEVKEDGVYPFIKETDTWIPSAINGETIEQEEKERDKPKEIRVSRDQVNQCAQQ